MVEYRYGPKDTVCSLFFYDKDYAAVVTWDKASLKEISFHDRNLRLPEDKAIPVAVRIGETWLGDAAGRNPPYLIASADQERLSVPVQAPVEELLRKAPRITVLLGDHEVSVGADRSKMPALLKAVERCRAVLK